MNSVDTSAAIALKAPRLRRLHPAPKRSAPYDVEPGYYEEAALWLYGNVRLFHQQLCCVHRALGQPRHRPHDLDVIETEAEHIVLGGRVLVSGVHNAAHQRAAVVPLRWGAPRILVLSGGFRLHLGPDLVDEPFRAARLWRYRFDPSTDLVISRRAPDKCPTFGLYNPTVDRLISLLVAGNWPGLRWPCDPLMPPLCQPDAASEPNLLVGRAR